MRFLLPGLVATALLAGEGCSEEWRKRHGPPPVPPLQEPGTSDRIQRLERSNLELAERVGALERNAPPPRRIVEGKLTSVEEGLGLVVLSVGRESGVAVGDELTVLRSGVSVGRVRIDRSELHWSSGSVLDPAQGLRVGDRVSNRLPIRPEKP